MISFHRMSFFFKSLIQGLKVQRESVILQQNLIVKS